MGHERERGRMDPIPANHGEDQEKEKSGYAASKPFNRKKLILQLLSIVAVALAVAIGVSIFFKVDTVSVSGLEKYSYESVREAAGIQEGDSLLFFSRAEVSSKIMQKLPYVQSVRIGTKLPGTVYIVIEEIAVSYAVADNTGAWWLISADGKVLEQVDELEAEKHTEIRGIILRSPEVGAQAVAAQQHTVDQVAVTDADRLAAALQVLQAVESNELLNTFAYLDVTNPYDLCLWYKDTREYQFLLGDTTEMALKLACVKSALPEILEDYPSGTLDVSDPANEGGIPFTAFQ